MAIQLPSLDTYSPRMLTASTAIVGHLYSAGLVAFHPHHTTTSVRRLEDPPAGAQFLDMSGQLGISNAINAP